MTRRIVRSASLLLGLCLFVLVAVVGCTARPGDASLYPPAAGTARTIHLVGHGWHSGLVVPRAALTGEGAGTALRTIATRFRDYPLIEFGWGEARFYRQTATFADVDWRLGLEALFTPAGSDGVIQVVGLDRQVRAAFPHSDIVPVPVSAAGLARLLARLDREFRLHGGLPVEAGPGLYGPSLFYEGAGRFSYRNVCNHWAADLLDAAGLPVTPMLDTLPAGLILDLVWRSGLTPLPNLSKP